MSGVVVPLRPIGRSLTREERTLVRSVPGLAERAAHDVCAMHGGDRRDPDILQLAHLGVYLAAMTYDPVRSTFAHWAYYKAAAAILDGVRKDTRQRRMLAAARVAGCMYLASKHQGVEEASGAETDEALLEGLVSLARDQLAASLVGAAIAAEEVEGEDEIADREEWAEALSALGEVLGGLREEQRALLEAFSHGQDLKSIARGRGVSYWTLRDEFHDLVALVRARLAGRGVKHMPAPAPEGWAAVIACPQPANSR